MEKRFIGVTGASGFLGRAVCALLEKRFPGNVKRITQQEFNLMHPDEAEQALKGCKSIIHTAGLVTSRRDQERHPFEVFSVNSVMALNILKAAAQYGLEQIVMVGSITAYPAEKNGALHEELLLTKPPSFHERSGYYGLAKWLVVPASYAYNEENVGSVRVLVLPNLYGPADKFDHTEPPLIPNLVAILVKAAQEKRESINVGGGPGIKLDMLHVSDAAEAIVAVVERGGSGFEIVNAGSGKALSIKEICNEIAHAAEYRGSITWNNEQKKAPRYLDNTKIRKHFGWKAKVSFEKGIHETVAWYKNKNEEEKKRSS